MSAEVFLRLFSEIVFVLVFLLVLIDVIRRPLRTRILAALFFGFITLIVTQRWILSILDVTPGQVLSGLSLTYLLALPLLAMYLVAEFSTVPSPVMKLAAISFLVLSGAGFMFSPGLPSGVTMLLVLYFISVTFYAAYVTVRESKVSTGVTRRRLQAVAAGSGFLALAIFIAGILAVVPLFAHVSPALALRPLVLAASLSYLIGYAPPGVLRRAWQEPELRAFLGRAASLPRLPDTVAIVRELENGAATSLGAPRAAIGLWNDASQMLEFLTSPERVAIRSGETMAGRAFTNQRALLSVNAPDDDPIYADLYRESGAIAVLAAPITAGERRLGVLTVSAPRAPVFAEDDLSLVELLADQAAVILESRALIDEAARVQAREEVVRLKDDFLSAAAHDLRTPLTALVAQAQLLERKTRRDPAAPPDSVGIRRLIGEAERLRDLVLELLDATRVDGGRLIDVREHVDLTELVRDMTERLSYDRHPVSVDANSSVVGYYDRARIMQLVDNLVENAVKYSPDGGEVQLSVWQDNGEARLSVTDHGIGIPEADLPHVFDRFHRSTNVDDRRFSGLGLGLYICRGIAEQHGGRLWVSSQPGRGSTFHLALPLEGPLGTDESAPNSDR